MTTDKTPATLAVGVLAVMDRLRSEWRDESQIVGRRDSADALDAVHAAVAELIEADAAYDKAYAAAVGNPADEVALAEAEDRRAAALARVKGETVSNDKALATAKHGGCVQLRDGLVPRYRHKFNEWWSSQPCDISRLTTYEVALTAYQGGFTAGYLDSRSTLSAQPSPGGQDALGCIGRIEEAIEFRVPHDVYAAVHGELSELKAALAARQPVVQLTDTEIDARLNTLYRAMVASGHHNGGMSGVAWDRAVYRMASSQLSGKSGGLAFDTQPVARQSIATCPRDGTVVLLHWGEDHVSPGWWSAPASPVQNDDGTWPSDTGGFPWAFIDINGGSAFLNHAVDTEYGPTHWSLYATPPAQAVDLGQFRAQVAELLRSEFDLEVADPEDHRHDDGAGEAGRIASKIAALLDSQAVGNG